MDIKRIIALVVIGENTAGFNESDWLAIFEW